MDNTFWDMRRSLSLSIAAVHGMPEKLVGCAVAIPAYLSNNPDTYINTLGLPLWVGEQLRLKIERLPLISTDSIVLLSDPLTNERSVSIRLRTFIDARIEEVLEHQALVNPEREAIVDVTNNVRYTYKQLNDMADRLASSLYRIGVRPCSNVSVVIPTSADNFIAKFAINKIGGTIVNVNNMERGDAVMGLIMRSDSDTVIMCAGSKGTEFVDAMYGLCPEIKHQPASALSLEKLPRLKRIVVCGANERYEGMLSLDELLVPAPSVPPVSDNQKRDADVATIIHTSGSTAIPKGVMLTHQSILEVLCLQARMLNLSPNSRTCLSLPLFHAFGSIGTSLPTFFAGGTVVCMDRPDIPTLVHTLQQERCTVLCNVPSIYHKLLEQIHTQQVPTANFCLKTCVAAGSASTEQMLVDIADTFGVRDVIATYGMTETCTGVTGSRAGDTLEARTKTVGAVWPGVQVKFINPDTLEELPAGEIGEICVRGFNVMKGYYNLPEKTAEVLGGDGWLRTGDLGRIRPDGNICFVGRLKESIKKHGETVSPLEVENALQSHPGIAENYVVGVPDPDVGEEVVAFVCCMPNVTLTQEEVQAHCVRLLSRFKTPKYVFFVDSFPRSDTGKIRKRELRAMAQKLLGIEPTEY